MAVVGVAWAQTTHTIGWGTASGDAGTFTNFTETSGAVQGVLSFTTAKNDAGSAPAYNANASELRLYYNGGGNGGSITITPEDGITITDAVITTSTSPAVAYYVDGGSATSVTGSGNTYTISNISASSSLEIKNVNTSNTQLRIKTIAITYTSGGSTSVATTTAIDASGITNTDVYTGTAAGSLTATVTETESGDAVSGATVTWTSSKENVATIDEDGVVTLVAAGTTTITASYAGVSGEFGASSATYELTVTSSAPYEQPTEFEIGLNNALFGTEYTGSVSGITDDTPIVGTQDNVTVTYAGGGNHYVNDAQIRFYPNNKLTFEAPEGYEIKEIVFTSAGTWTATITADGYDSSTKTWTGSATSVLFTGSGSGRCDMSKAAITLGEPSSDPTINANNVNIAYDATSGEIAYTITNPVTGKTLQATADADWVSDITVGDEAITFTTTANEANTERVATFTLTYEGAEDKTVTVTQAAAPVVYTTIPDLFAAATSTATDVNVQFNNWVVTGVSTNGKNVFVTDGTNGFAIYDGSGSLASTYAVGNILAGLASCKLKLQNGYAQLQDVNAADLTIGTGGSVDFATITMADLAGINTGALVQYENLTCSVDNNKYYLTDGTTTIQVYNSLYADAYSTLVDGKTYNIKGVYQQYNTTKEILPRSADDIEEVIPTEPTVTVNPSAVEVDAAEHDGTITVSYENMGENLDISVFFCEETDVTTPADYDWIDAEIDNQNNVYYVIGANTATEARKAYMVVKVADADAKEVYTSNLITITQAAYVAPSIATLPFEFDGGKAAIEETDGLTQEGLGNDYASSPKLRFDTTGDWMLLQFDEEPGKLTFDIKGNGFSGGTFTVQTSEDGVTFTELASYTELGATQNEEFKNLDANVRFIKWIYTNKSSGNVALGNIKLEKPATSAKITIKDGFKATTFSYDKALDFTNVEGITAYIITDENGKTQAVTTVPAGEGLYIEGAAGDYQIPVIASAAAITGNKLIPTDGTTEFKSDESVTYYVFGKQNGKEAFYKVPTTSGYTPSANKAVLVVDVPASGAKEMIVIGGDVTGIESIENGTIVNDNYYTIDGKLVKGQPTQKGIYVVNGRKVVIK